MLNQRLFRWRSFAAPVRGARLGLALSLVVACSSLAQAPTAADFVVATDGDDANSGTRTKPFASLARAQVAVRELRKNAGTGHILVLVRGGEYALSEKVVFGPQDSDGRGGTVTFAAYPGESPVFTGGRRLSGAKLGSDGIWRLRVPDGPAGTWRFEQLYVNGRRAVRARSPNQFHYYVEGKVAPPPDPKTGTSPKHNRSQFRARVKDVKPLLGLSGPELARACLVAYHSWEVSRHRVTHVEPKTGVVALTGPYCHGFFHFANDERYHIENIAAALDAPGEWFVDGTGVLAYVPLPGEETEAPEFVAPILDGFLDFLGRPEPGGAVSGIRLRGLTFRHAGYALPEEGESSPQAASRIPAVIMADYARDIVIEDCVVEHTGTYAVWFRDGCRDCMVQRCLLQDLGAGGVRIGSVDLQRASDPLHATSHITVDNTIIRDGGHLWGGAIPAYIAHSGDNRVTHNDISAFPYSGVSVGWRWGYGNVPSVRNTITHNHIHHLGGVLADMGGIYTLGESPGTVLAYNLIHDIDGYGASSMSGIYNDNSTTDMLIENNLVYNVREGGYKFGSGRDVLVRNNIFCAGRNALTYFCIYYPERDKHLGVTLEGNILYGSGKSLLGGYKDLEDFVAFQKNLYWQPSGEALDFRGKTFEEWQESGRDAGSIVADPGFRDLAGDDYRLMSGSPATTIGFKPFDISSAGVYGSAAWQRRAQEFAYTPIAFPPPRPPTTFADDFEDGGPDRVPIDANVHVEGKGDAICVTDETAASGRRALRITDAPGLKYGFNPHFFYRPGHVEGISTLSFDLRVEEGTKMYHEWREYPGKPYFYTGPRFSVVEGTLRVAGREPLPLPKREWMHIEITVGHGKEATGTWELHLAVPGEQPVAFRGLSNGSPETTKSTWIGFVSDCLGEATFYLDNIRLSSSLDR
ncbi:MAG: right-handed parallel beta-helix repeat-containing protein [Lentisphaerae bacterium]|jgi:hypothetical protein|nr:right-handed parallel beta-helix repeat-containing protein [Lentisphaerota bacterium]MBT4815026.1 right-handed parallel beta-helix repeat-containing protein [Lentisphaerota bacterium]MBT5609005.1 right-handed parallel beta-helix repeat-containing protein [Lentisphaerota bacterium]MBT7055818.1 right-handed parallel beta-helix repeat-containing protein [Lentisphaerota bacterium]MBT7843377.1 right-handed parallel beta-helix repeat-containing protein [Lentisphaerota bacterium]